jgi:hypothetical protein
MNKCSVLVCGLALATLSSTPMFADTVFSFNFTGNSTSYGLPSTPFSGSGEFDTQATTTAGEFKIIGVTGTIDDLAITSLVAPGGNYGNDNLLLYTAGDASASLDSNGVQVVLGDNLKYAYLFLNTTLSPAGDTELVFLNGEDAPISITPSISPSAVPEPGSLALLGTGALGLIGTLRRRMAV